MEANSVAVSKIPLVVSTSMNQLSAEVSGVMIPRQPYFSPNISGRAKSRAIQADQRRRTFEALCTDVSEGMLGWGAAAH